VSHGNRQLLTIPEYGRIRKRYKFLYYLLITLGLTLIIYYLPTYLFSPALNIDATKVSNFISDFGGTFGFSIFMLALAGIGLSKFYKRKRLTFVAFITTITIASFFFQDFRIYANIIIAFLAAKAVTFLINRKYSLKTIRDFSMILIICGLLFGTLSYANRMANFPPDHNLQSTLEWMDQNLPVDARILSHPDNGFWIRQMAQRTPITDPLTPANTSEVWHLWDLEQARAELESLNTTHILITQDMLEGKTWHKPDQALHFLFKNSETFKNVYQQNTTEVWQMLED